MEIAGPVDVERRGCVACKETDTGWTSHVQVYGANFVDGDPSLAAGHIVKDVCAIPCLVHCEINRLYPGRTLEDEGGDFPGEIFYTDRSCQVHTGKSGVGISRRGERAR